jgi:hypothetical protein
LEDGLTPIDIAVGFLAPFIAGGAGVLAGYAGLKVKVKHIARDVTRLQKQWTIFQGNPGGRTMYVRRDECDDRKLFVSEELAELRTQIEQQAKATKGLQNFARWQLTNKDGLSLIEADQIINGE